MKKINLFFAAMLFSILTYAQQKEVTICGNLTDSANIGFPTSILANWSTDSLSGVQGGFVNSTTGYFCIYIIFTSNQTNFFATISDSCVTYDTIQVALVDTIKYFGGLQYEVCGGTSVIKQPDCNAKISAYKLNQGQGPWEVFAYPVGGKGYSYLWDTGDTTSSFTPDTTKTSTYCVTVTGNNGCYGTDCFLFDSKATPDCPLSVGEWADLNGNILSLDLLSYGVAPINYLWSDGDTTQKKSFNPPLNLTSSFVSVTVTDANGCQKIKTFGNSIQNNCTVTFTSTEDSTKASLVYFSSFPTGQAPFTYVWNFGNNTKSTLANPSIQFQNTSSFIWANLTVIDSNGCVSTYSDYVYLNPTFNTGCTADFKAKFLDKDPTSVPGEVAFTDKSTFANNITSWSWDFNDGTPVSTQQNPKHTFTKAGYYNICLTVSDGTCSDTYCQTYYVDPAWYINYPWNQNQGCDANFVALEDSTVPGVIFLVDLSYGNNLHYTWDFAGNIINTKYPFITFNQFGATIVCLTITDTLTGCKDTHCDTVTVDSLGNLVAKKAQNWGIAVVPTPLPETVATTVGNELFSNTQVNVFPNPTQGLLNVSIVADKAGIATVELIDVAGKQIHAETVQVNTNSSAHTINLEKLPLGIYFINVYANEYKTTGKVVKIK